MKSTTILLVTVLVAASGCSILIEPATFGGPNDGGQLGDASANHADSGPRDAGTRGDGGASCQTGATRSCPGGSDVGECMAGTEQCNGGAWGACEGSIGPATETCDGLDNDCDGMTDGPTAASSCGTAARATTIGCSAGTCVITGCSAGYADCDGSFGTGCEAAIGTVDACTACGDHCDWNCGGAGGCDDAIEVVSGLNHHCARLESGTVTCWGTNSYGQLGDGTTATRLTPVMVPGLSDIAELSAGLFFTCARTNGGVAYCWGRNDVGQLGDGTMTQRNSPTAVSGLSAVSAIGAGDTHACAVVPGGFIHCWGDNSSGQLGDGTTTRRLTPVSVSGLGGSATDVTGGSAHTCAMMGNQTIECWGYNGDGQLGDGTTTMRQSPTTIPSLSNVTMVDAGSNHTCALAGSGTLYCWGSNDNGQIGNGSSLANGPRSPTTISLGEPAAWVSAGNHHTCAAAASGAAFCWGDGGDRIGDGSTSTADRRAPVAVVSISGIAEVSAGGSSCARSTGGALWCWGGGTGDGTTTSSNTPVAVAAP